MSLLLLLSLLGFVPTPAEAQIISPITVEASTSTVPFIIAAYAHRAGVSEHTELLQRIAYCESKNEPSAKGYNRKDGKVWSVDRSIFQINDYYHPTLEDAFENIEYGINLFKKEGTKPWGASRYCWDKLGGNAPPK